MKDQPDLGIIEKFYMALADKTRLRLLNLMRSGEVCVCFFTEVLGESQPKISRHLAYLRNAGLVEARRDGKWMHYSIVWPDDAGSRQALQSTLDWLAERDDMQIDLENYKTVCCTPELLVQIARTPIDFLDVPETVNVAASENKKEMTIKTKKSAEVIENEIDEEEIEETIQPEPVRRYQAHNELEEFLL